MKKIYLVLLLIGVQQVFAQNGKDPIRVSDMLKIKQLSSVTISPDGNQAAFVVNSIEPEADSKWEYKYLNQLYLVHTLLKRMHQPQPGAQMVNNWHLYGSLMPNHRSF